MLAAFRCRSQARWKFIQHFNMRQVRAEIEIRQGVKVEMLFTPRLYMFNGEQGLTLKANTSDAVEMFGLYADLMFCAALNLWTLQGKDKEDAPFDRVDFHEYAAANPRAFGKVVKIALEALTGKSIDAIIGQGKKGAETPANTAKSKKKLRPADL